MSCRQQTAPPQQHCSKDITAHLHRPGARPDHPCPVPVCSGQPPSGRSGFSPAFGTEFFFSCIRCPSPSDRGLLRTRQLRFLKSCALAAPDTGETQQRIKVTRSHIEVFNTFKNIEPIFGVSCWQFKGKAAASEFWTTVSNMPVYRNLAEEVRLKSARKTLNDLGYDRISKDADE